ncbi:hypothetical protein JOB18_043255 [Solea senegalensis]|uniref:Uncharacterized protein n=1 Tax=Solea senegalensis TaxID=28829 RepID=A0AAV6S8R3_SOLSE|nr:hypothetical protein JOB18_043255 [Solea senegalensis]
MRNSLSYCGALPLDGYYGGQVDRVCIQYRGGWGDNEVSGGQGGTSICEIAPEPIQSSARETSSALEAMEEDTVVNCIKGNCEVHEMICTSIIRQHERHKEEGTLLLLQYVKASLTFEAAAAGCCSTLTENCTIIAEVRS